ncbi:MAG: Fe-S cluster assembly protein SufB, partial [Bacteroidales bacterium]|nr:Fe-S cluster assembly protein SufB [Bacteroidales bacterium]
MKSSEDKNIITQVTAGEYKYGFVSDIETESIPEGLNEDVVRLISLKKKEPDWLLDFRLKAYRHWQSMKKPEWAHLDIPEIDYQKIVYYAAPKSKTSVDNQEEIDPDLLKTFDKLGIPLQERKQLAGMAVDAVM